MIKHKSLINSIGEEVKNLPDGIQQKIAVYNKMQKAIVTLTGAEKTKKQRQLKNLDQEIYDDLLEEYEDELSNNDLPATKEEAMKELADTLSEIFEEEESKPEKPKKEAYAKGEAVEIIGGNPKYIGLSARVVEFHPSGTNSKAPESVTLKSPKFPEGKALYQTNDVKRSEKMEEQTSVNGDEIILQQLIAIGRTKDVERKVLRDLGLKTPLGRKPIVIGTVSLTKSRLFSFTYDLKQLPKKDRA